MVFRCLTDRIWNVLLGVGWESAKSNFKNEQEWADVELRHVSKSVWCRINLSREILCPSTTAEPHASLVSASTYQLCDTLWGLHLSLIEFHIHYCSLRWNGNGTFEMDAVTLRRNNFSFKLITDRNSQSQIPSRRVQLVWLTLPN